MSLDEIIKELEVNDNSLTQLAIMNRHIDYKYALALADAITTNPSLTSILIYDSHLDPFGAAALAAALETNNKWETLELDRNEIGDEGAMKFAKALKVNTSLTLLKCYDNNIGPDGGIGLAKALTQNRTLTSLDLGSNGIRAAGAGAFANALQSNNSSLASLNLWGNQIGDEGTVELASSLRYNSALTELNLGYNNFYLEGTEAIAEALKDNKALMRLDLPNNHLTDGIISIADMLKSNNTLTYLGLGANNINSNGAIALANALTENRVLTKIALGGNHNICGAAAQRFAEMLKVNTSLTSINFWGTQIGDEGAMKFAEALTVNTSLTSLDLGSCKIGIIGMEAIANALTTNTTLTYLNINCNNCDNDEKLTEIKGYIERNKKLAKSRKELTELLNQDVTADISEKLERFVEDFCQFNHTHALQETQLLNTMAHLVTQGLNAFEGGNDDKLDEVIQALINLQGAHAIAKDALALFVRMFALHGMMNNALPLFRHCIDNQPAAEDLAHLVFVDSTLASHGFPSKERYLLIWALGKDMLLKPENKYLLDCVLHGAIEGKERSPDVMFGDSDTGTLVAEIRKLEAEYSLCDLLERAIECFGKGQKIPAQVFLQSSSFFKKLHEDFITAHRHESPEIQRTYDERFGLVLRR